MKLWQETCQLETVTLLVVGTVGVQWAHTVFIHDIAVLLIMTLKHFWLFKCIWQKFRAHAHYVLPIIVTCIVTGPLRTFTQPYRITDYIKKQKVLFPEVLWPYTMITVTKIGNAASCDLRFLPYTLIHWNSKKCLKVMIIGTNVMYENSLHPLYYSAIFSTAQGHIGD